NQLEWDKTDSKKILITNVQAKSDFKPIAKQVTTQRPIRPSKYITPSDKNQPIGRLNLQFKPIKMVLESKEHLKLKSILKELNISSDYSVLIFSGTAKSVDNIPAPQISKLRVQTIARVIYPYTQTVKMFHRPSIEEGTVVVEFFEPIK
ncbi:MAG: hypothetical protein KAG43_07515, partial [Candidatus Marithrix sp.]|nr:hypothetical protein [Candidatus Marithrix sp.]